ncbi:heme-dependent oxidative N-demethylase family protein [Rhodospirillum centenum]|uniref:DUF3445 domain-containing protein n=1 Tax=Rhodospirillum centenum (strain ATCC 51521 / SW) TaxID=414684 RepID=B6IXW8_RHOCS|nr:DUF3445 domain-containing protein [Rhodospirillum centenum]ACJ01142.1 conserved hypothetical protein [Rhodospirillum centenum SW]
MQDADPDPAPDPATDPATAALPPEDMPWPFDTDGFRIGMGLRHLDPADWIRLDATWPDLLAERRHLLRERGAEVLLAPSGTEVAARDLLHRLASHLPARFPSLYARDGRMLLNRLTGESLDVSEAPPLETACLLVPEDLCLLRREAGAWRLAAGIVCFPNRWRLAEKAGRGLPGIHEPVPGYTERLAIPVDRFFDTLAPGRGVWRTNWSLNDDPALFQPGETAHLPADAGITAATAGDRLLLRVERQTLLALPESGAVVFGIRTYQRPLSRLSPAQARQFAAVLRDVPEDSARYKGLLRTREPALAVLDRRAAGEEISPPASRSG